MVGIVTGLGLGLQNSSSAQLGINGLFGQTQFGRGNENIHINAANGNLILQQVDEFLSSSSFNINLNRTYNSQGLADDDNADNWRLGYARKIHSLTGTLNSVGSSITRTAEDGSVLTYHFDNTRQAYVGKAAHGGTYTLQFDSSANLWVWQDSANGILEYYDLQQQGRLSQIKDKDGNHITLQYNAAGIITTIRNSNGDALHIDYDTTAGRQANIVQLRTESTQNGVTQATQKVRYQYDGLNRLTEVIVDLSPEDSDITDGNTYVTRYTYDGDSRRINGIEQSDGSRLAFEYVQVNGQWRIASVQDIRSSSDVRITRFDYGADGLSTIITDPMGQKTTLKYTTKGQLLQVTGPQVDGQSQTLSYAYDQSGNLISMTDAGGAQTVYRYDANGNCIYERDALGNTIERAYNGNNQITSQTSYKIADPDGSGSGLPQGAQTIHYLYDEKGHARFVISAEGRVTENRYDSQGRISSQIQYSGATIQLTGAPTLSQLSNWSAQQNLALTQRTDTTYDLRGQISQITRYAQVDNNGVGVTDGTHSTTHYIYDANGNVLQTIDSRGAQTHYIYDGLNRIISQKDALGNTTTTAYLDKLGQTKVTLANGLSTISQYDRSGNLLSVLLQDSQQLLGTTTYQYDKNDQLRCVTDPLGQKNLFIYDQAGRKVGQIDATGLLTEFRYNLANQVMHSIAYSHKIDLSAIDPLNITLAQIRPVAHVSEDRHQYNLYDAIGRLGKSITADGAVSAYQYDGTGQLIQTTQYAQRLTEAQLSTLKNSTGELSSTDLAVQVRQDPLNDRTIRQFYDADGLLLGTLDAAGYLTENIYDSSGRLNQSIRYANKSPSSFIVTGTLVQLRPTASTADQQTQYFYDAQNRIVGLVDAEGYLTENIYDTVGNQVSQIRYATLAKTGQTLTAIRPNSSSQDQIQLNQYDALDRLIKTEQQPLGLVVTYQYDAQGNLIQTDRTGNHLDPRIQLSKYDSLGRLIAQLQAEGAKALASASTPAQIEAVWAKWGVQHRYDTLGRLIATHTPDGTGSSTRQTLYYYDQAGRLTHTINALGEVTQNSHNSFGELSLIRNYAKRINTQLLTTLKGGNPDELTALLIGLQSSEDIIQQIGYNQLGQITFKENALGQQIRLAYDAFGQVQSQYDPLSGGAYVKTDYLYDQRGLLLSQIKDSGGLNSTTQQQYDAFGRVINSQNALGQTSHYQYDRLGRQIQVTDPLNQSSQSHYDAFGRTLSHTDALGHTTTWQYDGNKMTMISALGLTTISQTNAFGETVHLIDGKGNQTSYEYDANGQLLKTIQADGTTTTNQYDAAGQLITSTDARGVNTVFIYDAVGRVLTRTLDPNLWSGQLDLTTQYSYDAFGRTVSITDPRGVVTQTQYDANGQILSVIQDVGGLNLTTTYKYDEAGRTVSVTQAANTPEAHTTHYQYDALGRRINETIDPDGLAITTHYQYNQNDQLISKTDPLGHRSHYVYDANGQLIYSINALGTVTQTSYDGKGQVLHTVSYAHTIDLSQLPSEPTLADIKNQLTPQALDQQQYSVYDADGRLTQKIDALGYVTDYQYDAVGNLTHSTRYATALTSTPTLGQKASPITSGADQRTHHYYNALNRLSHTVDAQGYVSAYEYDAAGNLLHTVQYANKVTGALTDQIPQVQEHADDRHTYAAYDAAGRKAISIDAMGYGTEYLYDQAGNCIKTNFITLQFNVNAQLIERLSQVQNPIEAAYSNLDYFKMSFEDILAGLENGSLTENDIFISTQYSYDKANRLITSTDALGHQSTHQYNAAGQLLQTTQAAGTDLAVRTEYQYDAAGRLTRQTQAAGTAIAQTTTYQYDANGNRISMIDARGIEAATTDTEWALSTRLALGIVDAQGKAKIAQNLSDAEKVSLQNHYRTQWQYNALGQVIVQTDTLGYTTRTEYDAFGNAVKVTDPRGLSGYFYFNANNQAILAVQPDGSAVHTQYNAFGKATQITRYHQVLSGNLQSDTYPTLVANSQLDQITRISYDKRDLQTSITDAEGYIEQLSYDAFGNKISYTNKLGGVYRYQYDHAGRVTQETMPIQARNSVGALIDVVKQYQYDARGNLIRLVEAAGLPEERVTLRQYDLLDRLINTSIVMQLASGGAATTQIQETRRYDALGQLIKQTDASGGLTQNWYDALGRKTAERNAQGTLSQWDYDAAGNAIAQRIYADPVATGSNIAVDEDNVRLTEYRFDAMNRLVASIIPEQLIGSRNPATGNYEISKTNLVTRYQYDAAGNVILQVDARGSNTYRYYDKMGRKVLEIDSMGYATTWQYDGAGNITQEHRYAKKPSISVHSGTQMGDIMGSLTADNSSDRISQFTYDRLNQVTQERHLNVLAANVNTISGAVTEQSTDAVTRYQYNGLGKVIEQTDALGGNSSYRYDVIGREIQRQGTAFVDHRGVSVRPTTDKEYNGLDQISRNIIRGENNASEADDQITRYQYGLGGLLLDQYDPTGARTAYQYNAAGQITLGTVYEYNGTAINTAYRYDAMGREIERKDVTTGMRYETQYNAYGEVTGKRTGTEGTGIWQEYAEYDNAGRVIKSNSNGSQKAYIYDANGNATLQIEAPDVDLRNMTIEQIIQKNNGVFRTVTQYDKANRVTDIYQPTMQQARDLVVVKQWITVTPNDSSGGIVEVGPNGQEISIPNTNPIANGATSINASGTANATLNFYEGAPYGSIYKFTYKDAKITFTLPSDYSSYGDGAFHMQLTSLTWVSRNGTAYLEKVTHNAYNNNIVKQANGTYLLIFELNNVKIQHGGIWMINTPEPFHTLSLSKTTNFGEVTVSDQFKFIDHGKPPSNGSLQLESRTTPVVGYNQLHIKGQPLNTEQILMYYRPVGNATNGWRVISVSKSTINGQTVPGQFSFFWSGIPYGDYEFSYIALDKEGNPVNRQYGQMNLSANPSIWQNPRTIFGAGSALLDDQNNLNIIGLGAEVKQATIRYRIAGTNNWMAHTSASTIIDGKNIPGWFTYNANLFQKGQKYEYIIEGIDAKGNTIKQSVGSFTAANAITVSTLTAYEDQPQIVHFKNQNLSATHGVVRYRLAGSATWNEAQLTKNGAGQFYWDATGLFTDKQSSADYEYEYLLYDKKDYLINHAQGQVRLGKENKLISHVAIHIPPIVSFNPSNINEPLKSKEQTNISINTPKIPEDRTKYLLLGSNYYYPFVFNNADSETTQAVIRYRKLDGSGEWVETDLFKSKATNAWTWDIRDLVHADYLEKGIVPPPISCFEAINKGHGAVWGNFMSPNFKTNLLRTLNQWATTDWQRINTQHGLSQSAYEFDLTADDADNATLRYRIKDSQGEYSQWETVSITKNRNATYINYAPSNISYDYEYEYLMYGPNGQLLNNGIGEVRLGSGERKLINNTPVTLTSGLPSNAEHKDATHLNLYYRPYGSSDNTPYQIVSIPRGSNGLFNFDVSDLIPKNGNTTLEYYYELTDKNGNKLTDANGDIFRVEGGMNLHSTGQGRDNEIKYVVTGVANEEITIHRSQQHNAFGEIIQETDGLGRQTQFTYNTLGKLIQKQDPQTTITLENGAQVRERPTTRYYYDLLGNTVAVKDANGQTNSQIFLAGSNGEQARVLTEFHADGGQKTNRYDLFGNMRQSVDEVGRQTKYSYDKNNRLTRLDRNNGGFDSYQYDARGQRIAHATTADGTTLYTDTTSFDSLGRVTQTTSAAGRTVRYAYQWASAIAGAGGIVVGGWRTTQTDANGRTLIDDKDVFNRLIRHVDLGGHVFNYLYNHGGQLVNQNGSTGQNIQYTYYGNGYIKDMTDHAIDSYTFYEYDKEGNRTFEGYTTVSGSSRTYYQYSEITYDELNRIKSINDPKFRINYEYDAVGNRRRVQSYYHDGISGNESLQDYWYRYDNMNRFVVTMGVLNGARGSGTISAGGLNGEGVEISYNAAGERISALYARDGHRETYAYDKGGYLSTLHIDGTLRASRSNDLMGRTTTYVEYNSGKWATVSTNSSYDADSMVSYQSTYSHNSGKDNESSTTTYHRYADGTINYTAQKSWGSEGGSATTIETHYTYEWWDEGKQSTLTSQPYNKDAPGWKSGTSHFTYDVNGHLKEAIDEVGKRSFRYTTNAQGLILKRDEIDNGAVNRHHDYYYVDGKRVGDVGNDGDARVDYAQSLAQKGSSRDVDSYKKWQPVSSADFDQNYEPIGPGYPGQALTHYTVRTGDTLQGIALSLWGDSALWYLLADANGLTGSEALTAGHILTVPNKVTNIHNNSATMRVYNPGEAIGDTSPTLPKAPPPPSSDGACGGFGIILVAIVAIIVTIYTAGAAATVMAPAAAGTAAGGATGVAATMSVGAAAMSGGMGLAVGMASAAIGAAVGSIAAQGLSMAMGMQDDFSWSQVGIAAIGAAFTAGVGAKFGAIPEINSFKDFATVVGRATAGNAVTQGVSVATGLQQKFNWVSVAASGVGAAVGAGVGIGTEKLGLTSFMPKQLATIADSTLKGLANGAAQSAITGHGFKNLNWGEIAANSFGSALGDELTGAIAKKDATASTQTSEIDPIQYGFSNQVISELGVIKPNQYDYASYNFDALQKVESATVNASDYKGSVERIAREKLGKNASQHEINTYVGQLIELNQIKNPRFIKANQILTLPNEHTPLPTTGLEIYAKDILYGENLKAQRLWVAQQQAAARQAVTKQGDYFDFNKHHTDAKGGLPYGNEAGEYSNALFKNLGTSMANKYTQHSQPILTQDTSSRFGRIKAIWSDNNTTTLNKLGDTVGVISTPSAQRAKQHNVALSFNNEDTWSGVSKELTAMTIDMGNQVIQTQPFLQTHTYIFGFDASKYSTQIRSSITHNESAGAGEVEKMALFLSIASLGRGGGKSIGHYGKLSNNIVTKEGIHTLEQAVSSIPGRVQSRVNLYKGSQAEGAGWNHVINEHYSGKAGKSQFTVSQNELRTILQSEEVIKTPISRVLPSADGSRYVREVNLGRQIGIDKFSKKPTSIFTILTDRYGNLITTTPGVIK